MVSGPVRASLRQPNDCYDFLSHRSYTTMALRTGMIGQCDRSTHMTLCRAIASHRLHQMHPREDCHTANDAPWLHPACASYHGRTRGLSLHHTMLSLILPPLSNLYTCGIRSYTKMCLDSMAFLALGPLCLAYPELVLALHDGASH